MLKIDANTISYDLLLELMGYLIPVTPQAFVNRISRFGDRCFIPIISTFHYSY